MVMKPTSRDRIRWVVFRSFPSSSSSVTSLNLVACFPKVALTMLSGNAPRNKSIIVSRVFVFGSAPRAGGMVRELENRDEGRGSWT